MLEKDSGGLMNRRERREANMQMGSLVTLCLALIVVTGLLITFHVGKLTISEEIFFPQIEKYPSLAGSFTCSCNSSSSSSSSPPDLSFTGRRVNEFLHPKELWHSMTDEELMWRASMVPRVEKYPYQHTAKVAFMFLIRGRLPLGPIWEWFFKGHDGLYNIYLHSSPEFKEEALESSVFFKRRIPSKQVEWGTSTMIDAERRLLANALLDFSNERFVLLSETCIPLFNFTTIYNYLINSNQAFLGSFDDPRPMGRGRYNKRMWPLITLADWRKGSQWFTINRKIAIEIISDRKYYPAFRDHCRPPCYMDEHYLSTLVTMLVPGLNSNRTVTWVDWSRPGSHPVSFRRKDITDRFLNRIRYGSNCTYNGNMSSICFLFARKFEVSALEPLLQRAPALLGFHPLN